MTDTQSLARASRIALAPLLHSLSLTVVCHLTLGPTTALFFAGTVLAAILIPPLSCTRREFVGQLFVVSGTVGGVAVGWAFATSDDLVGFADWIRAVALLAGFGLASWGMTAALVRLRLPPVLSSAIAAVLAMAWLAWPIWLSLWLAGRDTLVDWLTWPHPLLALDGALRHLGPPWTERPLMYTRLTVLNQDVFYALPPSVWPGALLHALVGAGLLFLSHGRLRPGAEKIEDRG